MTANPRILFAAGGTGGHIYPAVAIADAVRAHMPEAEVVFAGTRDRMEWEKVPQAGYEIYPITIRGFDRQRMWRNVALPVKVLQGLWQSWQLVRRFDADVVVGTGGYVTLPVLFMAQLLGRPTVIQEQNAHAGVTNRFLAKRATEIHIAFPEAEAAFPAEKCELTGNPTRPELTQATRAEARAHYGIPEDQRVLLVFGGSLGSAAINAAVKHHMPEMLAVENLTLLWQSGAHYFEKLQDEIDTHPRLHLMQFIDRMDLAYAAADLVVCRAGAITCSELLVTGTPAILVPSPNVAEDHQTKNARSLVDAEAALLLPEHALQEKLLGMVFSLLDDAATRHAMAENARHLARPDAADRIAEAVLELARSRHAPAVRGEEGNETEPK